MLLIPNINFQGNLSLDAYSFSNIELNAVTFVLEKSKISIRVNELPKDYSGRFGIRFFVLSIEISKLEQTLNIKFGGIGENTKIKMEEGYSNFSGGGPSSYKCKRLDNPPPGCQTIYAFDDKEAVVLCGLIANDNNWLGGISNLGNC